MALAVLCIVLAWELYERSQVQHRQRVELQAMRKDLARAEHERERALAKLQVQKDRELGQTISRPGHQVAKDTVTVTDKLQTMGWIQKRHLGLKMAPVGAFDHGALSLQLAVMLGLKPEEYDRLNAAIEKAKRQLDDAAIAAAKTHISADGRRLVVSVPSIARAGDTVYADLLNSMTQILGPKRFRLFNTLAGSSFDNSFDRFGLDPVTYELTLKPSGSAKGTPTYEIRSTATEPDSGGYRWGVRSETLAGLEKDAPVLAHFLPPNWGK